MAIVVAAGRVPCAPRRVPTSASSSAAGPQFQICRRRRRLDQNARDGRRGRVVPDADRRASPRVGDDGVRVQTDQLTDRETSEVTAALAKAYDVDATERHRRRSSAPPGAPTSPAGPHSAWSCSWSWPRILMAIYFRTWKMSVAAMRRAAARPHHHGRRLRRRRVRGHAGGGHRLPDDPRLLALRHGRGVRQDPREHRRDGDESHAHLRRGGQPRGQPDPGALDQHVGRGAPAGRGDPVHRVVRPRRRHAARHLARAVRRNPHRHLLDALRRVAAVRAAARARAGDQAGGRRKKPPTPSDAPRSACPRTQRRRPIAVQEITVEDAIARIASTALLVDVREPREWDAVHAPQATLVPMSELTERSTRSSRPTSRCSSSATRACARPVSRPRSSRRASRGQRRRRHARLGVRGCSGRRDDSTPPSATRYGH